MNKPALKRLENSDSHNCFGCSQHNDHGLKMIFFSDESGENVVSEITVPDHLAGWNNLAHGGIISTILDEIMSWTIMSALRSIMLTKTMSVEFIKPVTIGQRLTVKGRVLEKINDREAVAEGLICDEEGSILARSKGVFALFTVEAARRFSLMS